MVLGAVVLGAVEVGAELRFARSRGKDTAGGCKGKAEGMLYRRKWKRASEVEAGAEEVAQVGAGAEEVEAGAEEVAQVEAGAEEVAQEKA